MNALSLARQEFTKHLEEYCERRSEYQVERVLEILSQFDKDMPICEYYFTPYSLFENPIMLGIYSEIIPDYQDYRSNKREIIVYGNTKKSLKTKDLTNLIFSRTVGDFCKNVLEPFVGKDYRVGVLSTLYYEGQEDVIIEDRNIGITYPKYSIPDGLNVYSFYQLECGAIASAKMIERNKNCICRDCCHTNTCNCSRYSYYRNEWRYSKNPHQYYYGSLVPIEAVAFIKDSRSIYTLL